jgi:hypothetical protein
MLSCLSLFEGLMTHIDQSDYRSHDPYFHFVLMYDIIENKYLILKKELIHGMKYYNK